MFKKAIAAAFAVLVVFSYAKAEEIKVDFDGKANQSFNLTETINSVSLDVAAPEATEVAVTDKKPKVAKEWTIMVFLNNKNNLHRYGLKDMNEMEMVGSTDKVNIVVELGAGADSTGYSFKGTKRYYVTKDNNTGVLSSQVVQNLGKVDMGDYNHMAEFGQWAKANYPAGKYMLVVWNHGSGWEKSLKAAMSKGISYDDETDNHITTPQFGAALKAMGKIDVVGSDACLMGMAEVVYELKDSVTYVVGSEETEPGDGYTYNTMLAPLAAKPAMSPAEFAKNAVQAYVDHYAGIGEGSTQAYIKTSALSGFLTAVNDFATAMTNSGDRTLVKASLNQAQSYAISDNKDLYHFAELMAAGTKDAAVKEKGQALMTYIKTKLVGHNAYSGGYSDSHGIAIYMPSYGAGDGYDELQWAQAANWDEFIKWYQAKDEQPANDRSVAGQICKWVLLETLETVWDKIKQEYIVKPIEKWAEECNANATYQNNPGYGGNPSHTEQVRTGK